MKAAVIAVTENGARLALLIHEALSADLYVKAGRHALSGVDFTAYESLQALVDREFHRYDQLIFIMAAGIVVRVIAPHVVDKQSDPAVVVLDEKGRHAISLLSGHIGGANALASHISEVIGATAVITTATDINGRIAADLVAAKLGLRLSPIERLKYVNAEIAGGGTVDFFIDVALEDADFYQEKLRAMGIAATRIDLARSRAFRGAAVCVTERARAGKGDHLLLLMPRKLAVGLGCRRGAGAEEIMEALHAACAMANKTCGDIARIASTVIKRDEPGLLAVANRLNVPITFYENRDLQDAIERYHLAVSSFVLSKIGVGNVCEAAALLSGQSKKLVVRKTKFPKVTVAIAWET